MGFKYDDPNFLLIRQQHPKGADGNQGSISAGGLASAYVGSTLKVYNKCVVLGVTFQVQSGGSLAGTNSIKVSRIGTGGTQSAWKTLTVAASAGASMANNVLDISLNSALTIHSLGEGAVITANATSLDKCIIIKNIVWRYRMLPQKLPSGNLG